MMTDPIADMLTRIRNAVRVERPQVEIPVSKVKRGLAEVLKREGYIWDWEEVDSKPGRRVYSGAAELKPILGGLGICIISTSRGVISDREARQRKLGGEVLCEIW